MSNKAKNDRDSILIDTIELLKVYEPAFARLPKIRRIHGSAVEMKNAAWNIIRNFHIAKRCGNDELEIKKHHLNKMIGEYGVMQTAFIMLMSVTIDTQKSSSEDCIGQMYLFSDSVKLAIARNMEKIEEGIMKWKNSIKSNNIMSGARSVQTGSAAAELR